MPETHLRVTRPSPGVVLATLANPDQRNAMSGPMTQAWAALMADLATDTDLRVLVVTGEGSAFCSGGDTSWIAAEPDASVGDLRARMLPFYRTWLSVLDLDVPTLAAVNGPAIGAGLCLALACDVRYAASGAVLGAPFVRLGMHPGMAATWLLPDVVGPAHARDLLLTGRTVDADEALRLGLVSRVLEPDGLPRGRCWRPPPASPPPRPSPVASRHVPCAVAAMPTWTRRCVGKRSPSPSRSPPTTSRRASARPASVGSRGSPAVEPRRVWGIAGVARRGPRCRTSFAFPLRTSSGGLGPRLGNTLGGGRGQGQHGAAGWSGSLWTSLWTTPRNLWTTGGRRGIAWGHRCGARRSREARER